MHYVTCLLAALCSFGFNKSLTAQVCESPIYYLDFFGPFFLNDEYTVNVPVDYCVEVDETFAGGQVSLVAELRYEGESTPGIIEVRSDEETRVLSQNLQAIDLPNGIIKITVRPVSVGTATVTISQDYGLFTLPIVTNTFDVVENVLPVRWTQPLAYNIEGEKTGFTWGVADQRDVAGYTVERREGDAFIAIREVGYVENGADEVIYQTSIPAPTTDGYYRIRQTDFAGTYSFSNTVYVPGADATALRVYPNPAGDHIRLATAARDIDRLELHNLTGELVREVDVKTQGSTPVSVADLPAGIYLVSAIRSTGRVATCRLVVK